MKYLSLVLLFVMFILSPVMAQTTATLGEKAVGTSCANGAAGADFDTLFQCSSITATAGTKQKAPLFIGAVTSPPYAATTCDAAKAGLMQYTSTNGFQGCDGSSWATVFGLLGSSATSTSPRRTGDITTGMFSDTASTVSIATSGVQRLTVTATGNVGIGTASPNVPLGFGTATGDKIRLYDNAGTGSQFGFGVYPSELRLFTGTNISSTTFGQQTSGVYTELMRLSASGFVGIGTAAPATALDVVGTVRATAQTVPTSGSGMEITYNNGQGYIGALNRTSSAYLPLNINSSPITLNAANDGNVGIGTTIPSTKLHVSGLITAGTANSTSGSVIMQGLYNSGALSVWGSEYSSGASVTGYGVKPSSSAVGSFLSTTTIPLVRAALTVGGSTSNNGFTFYTGATQTVAIGSAVTMSPVVTITNGGNVGIGTTSPAYPLHAIGDIKAEGGWLRTTGFTGWINETYGGGWYMTDASWIRSYNGKYVFMSNGFDTSSPSGVGCGGNLGGGYTLAVCGTAYASGAAGSLSDMRHKKDIRDLPIGGLATVGKLRPIVFSWKEPKDDGMKGEQYGFIAQEVEKVAPTLVLTQPDKDKTKAIKTNEFAPILVKAIQEMKALNDAQTARIGVLEKRIEELERKAKK